MVKPTLLHIKDRCITSDWPT